ncbi:glutaredoxin-like protein NrdH [Rhodococcus sp. NPDC019627]|uniref:glutaredoxin-like protein NrdH n=1 Tax=unclassified Rhodococcus (in: high G+C Gram-positive bacteria) TaxID=192944 RepID=UPI0033C88BDC
MTVTIYAKPACMQCNATYRAPDKAGVDYTTVDITEESHAREQLRILGYLQAPVVTAGDEHWSGYRPDRIRRLTAA